jgi:hypothetical protein
MTDHKQAMQQALSALHNAAGMLRAHTGPDDALGVACIEDARAAITALRAALSSIPDVQVDSIYEQRLRSVLDVVMRWLTPDGIDSGAAMGEIIGLVDPWPLSAASAPKEPQ